MNISTADSYMGLKWMPEALLRKNREAKRVKKKRYWETEDETEINPKRSSNESTILFFFLSKTE